MLIVNRNYRFKLNNNYLFKFDKETIEYYDLGVMPSEKTKTKLDLDIRPNIHDDFNHQIKDLYFGLNHNEITIVIKSSGTNVILFTWNLTTNTENEGYDLDEEYELIYNEHGALQIVD